MERADLLYGDRVSALKAGAVAGVPSLDASHVTSDTSVDTISGGAGFDWFFAKVATPGIDKLTDRAVDSELVN